MHVFGTHHITAELSGDLHLWGPEFTGKMHIKILVVSVTVKFGGAKPKPKPIAWHGSDKAFRESFLPPNDATICDVAVTDGLIRKVTTEDSQQGDSQKGQIEYWVVNPRTVQLTTNSVIPATKGRAGDGQGSRDLDADKAMPFGVAPMALTRADLAQAEHVITVERQEDGGGWQAAHDDFTATPVYKPAPVALWGQRLQPDLNGAKFIESALMGYALTPATPFKPGETHAIDHSKLQYATTPVENAYGFTTAEQFVVDEDADRQTIAGTIVEPAVVSTRDELLQALGFNSGEILVDIDPRMVHALMATPIVGSLG